MQNATATLSEETQNVLSPGTCPNGRTAWSAKKQCVRYKHYFKNIRAINTFMDLSVLKQTIRIDILSHNSFYNITFSFTVLLIFNSSHAYPLLTPVFQWIRHIRIFNRSSN